MKRIAVIFDNRLRPETTGLYCRRALGELVQTGQLIEVEHFLPEECFEISADRFDLFLFVDDGLLKHIPEHLKPAAWWAIDTHLDYERALSIAREADWSFAAQRRGANQLISDGIQNVSWLPLACDPLIHGKRPVELKYDLAFVGNLFPGERERLLNLIRNRYSKTFVGNKYLEEMAEIYSASRMIFNRSLVDDLNMRVFEGLCSGALLLTNSLPVSSGQAELFQERVHLASYSEDEQLLETVEYYLHNDRQRSQIAEQGRQEVLRAHTYRHRMETILTTITGHATSERVPSASIDPDINAIQGDSRSTIKAKHDDYFEHSRPDVLELIPKHAQKVLEIGCGGGKLGASLKKRQHAFVAGVEYDPVAAQRARQCLDEVVVGDIETGDINFQENSFDCVVCADVLEHLRDPESVLKLLRGWLKPKGCLVTSLPNIRNHTIIRSLLAGNWTYESAGLLDSDHVRFFTRREIEKLLFRTGFSFETMQMIGGDGYAEWLEQGSPQELIIGGLQVKASSIEEAAEFFAYQYLTRSTVSKFPEYGITSIIIVTHNQLAYTRQCVDSILLRTDEPYELIFVDNASTDGTDRYLQSLSDTTVILNETNRGFPAGVNQGIEVAKGDNILFLNNDTIVTTGWLQRMLNTLYSNQAIGLVGPVSNNISGPQQVATSYRHMNELDGFAWDWGKLNNGNSFEVDRLVGFCLLIKREVVERIGKLDERFGVGNFEDDDFCRRAESAGYRAVIALDSFVHHFGSVSFQGAGLDLNQILKENQKTYQDKWENGVASHNALSPSPESRKEFVFLGKKRPDFILESTSQGLKLQPNQLRLTGCLIVKDNENTIRPCLESLKPWVDEIVVIDTGSTDATPAICKELGARVFYWSWRDDFSAARNVSIDHARGEWVFWMDSDDTLPEQCGEKLRQLADQEHDKNVFGYIMQVHCPSFEADDSMTSVDHVKLFRHRPDLRFEHKIHEQIIPAIRRAGGDVAWTDLYVVHSGSDHSAEGRAHKLARDYKLLKLDLADRPDHPFVLFNLGMTYADDEKYTEAIKHLKRCLEVCSPDESHVRKAFALLINALCQIGQHNDAWEYSVQSLNYYPDDKELLFRQAMLHHHFGRLRESEETYLRVINDKVERHFTSIDIGLSGYKSRHNLAAVYEEMGQIQDAEAQWKLVTRENPTYSTGWKNLGEVFIKQGKMIEANQLVEQMQNQEHLRFSSQLLKARLIEQQGETDSAVQLFSEIKKEWPDELEPIQELSRLLFEKKSPTDALSVLKELCEKDPQNAATLHNLGTAFLIDKQFDESISAYHRSIELRPDSGDTWLLLGHAFINSGDTHQATNAWQETLKHSPNHREARQLLAEHGHTASP